MSAGLQIREIIELRNYFAAGLAIVQTFGATTGYTYNIIYVSILYIAATRFWRMTKWSAALHNN